MPHSRSHLSDIPIPDKLPLHPLRSTVVFPGGVAALQVADERSLELIDAVEEEDDVIGLFFQVTPSETVSKKSDLLAIGVAAKVVQTLKLGKSRRQLLCHGLARIELTELTGTDPFLTGRVEVLNSRNVATRESKGWMSKALAAYERLASVDKRYSDETVEVLRMNTETGADFFADLMASFLNIPLDDKRQLIGTADAVERLRQLLEITDREFARMTIERDLSKKASTQLEDRQREIFLREQLKVIQDTLGETTGTQREAEEYLAMIEDLPLAEEAKRALQRECERLAMMSEQSAEYPVQSNYLDTVFGLPWWESTEDVLDLRKVARVLHRDHYGLDEIKERLLEYLSVVKLKGRIAGPILCLAGPPGTGKTSIARSIADALGRKFVRISLGGVSDESEIRGHRKTYVGAMPGKIVSSYDQAASRNPVFLLDEIDKMGNSGRGDPAAALLEVLDPEQNRTFMDRYLGVPFDLSDTLFITTANFLDDVPGPLRDRLEVLEIAGYTEEEKVQIARRFLLPKLLDSHGLAPKSLQLTRSALVKTVRGYTSEPGMRELERRLAAICRKVTRRRATQGTKASAATRVTVRQLQTYLGPVRYEQEFAARRPEVGVATGLAWTGAGGAILFIEASRMEGDGNVEVTGQLGDVMRESVRAAYSYVRSHARNLEIQPETIRNSNIHIHFPAGAIRKDGPSAGIAAATCLASLLSNRPVRHDVAMTGEITLRGKILSVGGVKEKLLAAHRARIRKVLLPIGNRKDIGKVPEDVCKALDIVFVNRVEEAWKEALVPLMVAGEEDLARIEASETRRTPARRPRRSRPRAQ
ncbi:MAG: endopeptidase La [Acidobacteriota bacterium]|nr:endopeptidase La [Acidobacteriota bacterium]